MRYFTTTCDSNYFSQGLALYNSLMRVNPDFILYWLCVDQKAFDILCKLKLQNVDSDSVVPLFKSNRFSHKEYCWSLASRYTHYIMKQIDKPIAYLDADLYFYQNYEHIYKEIGDKSVGLVEHRIPTYKTVGKYNVGFVYFKNDIAGKDCLKRWSNLVANKSNFYFETHGQCGDQAYLMLFEEWYRDSVHVINCGHSAWWNSKYCSFDGDYINWNGKIQLLIYTHYSHFKLTEDSYTHDEMRAMSPRLKEYYDNYEIEVRKCQEKIR